MFRILKLSCLYSIEPHLRAIKAAGIVPNKVVFNPSIPTIYQDTFMLTQPVDIFTKKSFVSTNGALCAYSGQKTQRLTKNSRVVKDHLSQNMIEWNEHNIAMQPSTYDLLENLALGYINHKAKFYLIDGYLGWDPKCRLKVRTYCTRTYHALFLRNMLVRPTKAQLEQDFTTSIDITLFNGGQLNVSKRISGTDDDMITAISPSDHKISILGTQFAGQMKKSLFKLSNFILPRKEALPLRASAITTENDKVCLLIGLPGSGKGSLAIQAKKKNIIANDQIAWTKDGVQNLEGGVYAKILNLRNKLDEQVYKTIKFGAVVENANPVESKRDINFHDVSVTQNARLCYPIQHFKTFKNPPTGENPKNVILLTCDMEGVLPPVAKLNYQQALFFYLNGYTAKLNNKEIDPKSTFQTCYIGDSLILHPSVYGELFYERLKSSNANVWLLNTGWTGGKFKVGKRIQSQDSVKIIDSINSGELDDAETSKFNYFNFEVPKQIQGLNSKLLNPAQGWSNKQQYEESLKNLVKRISQNYNKNFKGKLKVDIQKYLPSL